MGDVWVSLAVVLSHVAVTYRITRWRGTSTFLGLWRYGHTCNKCFKTSKNRFQTHFYDYNKTFISEYNKFITIRIWLICSLASNKFNKTIIQETLTNEHRTATGHFKLGEINVPGETEQPDHLQDHHDTILGLRKLWALEAVGCFVYSFKC